MKEIVKYESPQKFAEVQRNLLQLEREAEIERTKDLLLTSESKQLSLKKTNELEKKGLGLKKLRVQEWTTSAFGRNLLTLAKYNQDDLPSSTISTGDIVGIYNEGQHPEDSLTGVVTTITNQSLTIALDDTFESVDQEASYFIAKLANDVTYKRLKNAIDNVEDPRSFSILHNFLFGQCELSVPHQFINPQLKGGEEEDGCISFINKNLNDSQKEAIEFALRRKELALIHGPPGTGKTTTIVELISQEVKQGSKVLCCAPSNVAVDNLLEKLAKNKIKVIRIGHPARVQSELQKYSLDAMLSCSEQKILAQDVKADMDAALNKLKKSKTYSQKQSLRNEMRHLRKELHTRESRAMEETLKSAEVVLATLTSASNTQGPLKHLGREKYFDLAVIDECSQALEISCWIALLQVQKVVLAGDHLQLPPTIMSEVAANKGLAFTLMERVIKGCAQGKQEDVVRMLNTQYRMNEAIMKWSSETFYEGKLQAHVSVQSRLLKDLEAVEANEDTEAALVLIDTTGCDDYYELVTEDEQSKANEGEAALVTLYAQQLVQSGVDPAEIAIITPYNLQVELLRLQLRDKYPSLEIRSVDGFQGREKEVVVLSLVRSNPNGEVGFLAEARRLNVAITRAKRHVAVITNVETVAHDPVLKGLVEHLEKHGEMRSAMQYEHLVKEINIQRPDGLELTLKDAVVPREISRSASSSINGAKKKTKVKPEAKSIKEEKSSIKEIPSVATTQNSRKAKKIQSKNDNVDNDEEKEIADALKRQQMQKLVNDFISDASQTVLHCSPDYTTYQRMLLHELAEKAKLGHASQGEGKKRHIVLTKPTITANSSSTPELLPTKIAAAENAVIKDDTNVICSTCSQKVPKANIQLHKLRCSCVVKKPLEAEAKATKATKKKNKKKAAEKEEEDIDKLLAAFDKIDNVCNAEGCKIKIKTLGVTCDHCRLRFCLKCGLPEAHGCAEAARIAARQQLSRDGQLYPGSGRPNFKPDPVKKAQLQRKLDKKLDEMQGARKPKKKS